MNQDKHLFQFNAREIENACKAEESYHRERLTHWQTEQQAIVDQARNLTATIKVREQAVTGGKRYEIIADITGAQELNWKLNECGSKIETHRRAADDFRLKGRAYGSQGTRTYDLDPSDVAFFRLNGGDRVE